MKELEDYEVICPQCKGTGKSKSWEAGGFIITPECPKCLGEGKFDWIQRVVGKARSFDSLEAWVTEKLSKEIQENMDEEILRSISEEIEQNQKDKEDDNDNGVIS